MVTPRLASFGKLVEIFCEMRCATSSVDRCLRHACASQFFQSREGGPEPEQQRATHWRTTPCRQAPAFDVPHHIGNGNIKSKKFRGKRE
ncbi:hypothetical protein [Burkholderia glumae]|uniref:hypothetical protein n=1 Tax=Burkholderia glumae TaxID=337 RepID=UPI001E2F2FF2|nr:hypothetical protein [Burkholderia glumae]